MKIHVVVRKLRSGWLPIHVYYISEKDTIVAQMDAEEIANQLAYKNMGNRDIDVIEFCDNEGKYLVFR